MATKSLTATIFGVDKASPVFDKVGRSASEMADETERSSTLMGKGFQKGAKMAAGALAAIGFVDFVRDTISQASDLQQAIGKTQDIFGSQANAMIAWSQNSAAAAGLSQAAALEATSTFGDMFTQIGFTSNQAAEMSKSVVQMSADLGAFNNLPTAEVLDDISGAMRGEYDALQKVIPNISAARVQQQAMADTGKKNATALTAQEKATATLEIIQKDGAKAAGNYADTQDQLATAQQTASAEFDNAKAKIGQGLLPIMTDLSRFAANDLAPALSAIGDVLGTVMGLIDDIPGPVKLALTALLGFKLFQQTNTFSKIADGVRSFKQDMAFATYQTDAGGRSVGRLGAAATVAKGRLGGFAKSFAKGGLIAGGVMLISSIIDGFNHVNQSVQAVNDSVEDLGKQLAENNGKWDESIQKAYENSVVNSDVFKALVADGADYGKTLAALTGQSNLYADANEEVHKHMGDLDADVLVALAHMVTMKSQIVATSKSMDEFNKRQKEAADQSTDRAKATEHLTDVTADYRDMQDDAKDAAHRMQIQWADLASQRDVSRMAYELAGRVRDTAKAMQEGYDKAHDLTSIASDLEVALARLSGREPTVEEATRQFNGALQDMIDNAHDADGKVIMLGNGVVKASGQIDTGTKAGAELYDQVTKLGQAAQDSALAQAELAGKTRGTKGAADAAAKSLAKSRVQFIKNAHQMGLTSAQAKKLADRYFGIPKNIKTVITGTANFADVDAKIQRLRDTTVSVDVTGAYRGVVGLPASMRGGVMAGLASGGHAAPGRSYLVGEEGPEILDMDPSGRGGWVTPHAQAMARLARGVTLGRRAAGGPVGSASGSLPLVSSMGGDPSIVVQVSVPGGFVGSASELADRLAGPLADAVARGKRQGRLARGAFVNA